MPARLRFTSPEARSSFTVADLEPLRIDLEARRVSGFFRRAVVEGAPLTSTPYDYALAELDFTSPGGPLVKLASAILKKLVADGKLPSGALEVS